MEKQVDTAKTLGQAIDELVQTLSPLDGTTRATAIRAVCEHLKIRLQEIAEIKPPSPVGVAVPSGTVVPRPVTDIRALREEKKPSSANEMAAIVAYYLSELVQESERKSEVDTEDMLSYFKKARFPLPRAPRVLLQNAKNAGYFDLVGEGKYRLNPVGYNLVAHNLPRSLSSGAVRQAASGKKRTKSSKIKK